ncbi:dihydrodipicolinate synthase family protein [Sulfobacillus thermosulfidooxidans]|uniref:dihydrodipicolinate synthase family protein n=1 Tax=Sulfobacillus thermosulfidooxidans TaxID=28034 RepID=UPI0003FAF06E|nr:dihydrodipicolinate synthase family protein [Sulfobacillus thermosulfidooxidans]
MSSYLLQTAMITPLTDDGQLDTLALKRLIQRILAAQHIGLSILGSTGEGASLPLSLRQQVRETVLELVGGKQPVFSGVMGTVQDDIIRDLDACRNLPLAGLLIPPPSYYPMNAQDLEVFYLSLADRSPFPIMLYNIPPYTKISIPAEVVAKLSTHPQIMGIKDSSRDFDYFLRVLHLTRHIPDFKVLIGTETLVLPALAVGGHGAVVGSGNIVPQWIAELAEHVANNHWAEARQLEYQLIDLATALRQTDGVRGFKFAAAAIDHHPGYLMAPYQPLAKDAPAALAISAVLKRYHLMSE